MSEDRGAVRPAGRVRSLVTWLCASNTTESDSVLFIALLVVVVVATVLGKVLWAGLFG